MAGIQNGDFRMFYVIIHIGLHPILTYCALSGLIISIA
jgi:hypothetical protein